MTNENQNKRPFLLIDADTLAYMMAASCEVEVDWGNDQWSLHSEFGDCKTKMDDWIASLVELLDAEGYELIMSAPNNWRKTIYPPYKENRKKLRKPVCLGAAREYLIYEKKARMIDTLEADDVIGIYMTSKVYKAKSLKVIVSVDKDFCSVPGNIYNPNRSEEGIVAISEEQADLFHLTQTLTGDSVDGYPGCPGIGAVRAEKLLRDTLPALRWEKVVEAYVKAGLTKKDALTQARIARIVRASEYDKKKGKVKLWNPTT